ncbi:hypothetical protein KQX54_021096 [Cotesia glomerata]|uniref:Uncharacterized protein n=1 Tax=Cotesia glomerata TaxID=32391 RepID=A0AAV7J685_COTGL|nr:hypothetical protein KQX54_021096 [Cotesia glomerata]
MTHVSRVSKVLGSTPMKPMKTSESTCTVPSSKDTLVKGRLMKSNGMKSYTTAENELDVKTKFSSPITYGCLRSEEPIICIPKINHRLKQPKRKNDESE